MAQIKNGIEQMQDSHAERKRARFVVKSEVELDHSAMLAPGTYKGRSTHLGFIKHEEYTWTPKRYFLELDAAYMGGSAPENATLVEYDVTKYVEDGSIEIE